MTRRVKHAGTTQVSSKHQVTLPVASLAETGIRKGDRLLVTPAGKGKLVLERVEEAVDEFAGLLTGRFLEPIDLDSEWD